MYSNFCNNKFCKNLQYSEATRYNLFLSKFISINSINLANLLKKAY